MKAFLLAAGLGTRLRPLTDRIPKCLVPIRGVPMLSLWLEVCRRAAIDEVSINLHMHADAVRRELRRHRGKPQVKLIQEDVLLGSAGTLRCNQAWVEGEQEFWVLYADVLTNLDLRQMLSHHRRLGPAATLGLYRVKEPSRCGIVQCDEKGTVVEFEEKPRCPKGNWAFSGVLVGTPELLKAIPPQVPLDLGYSVLPKLVNRMVGYPISDYLLDIGTMENYQQAQDTWPGFPVEVKV